MQQTGASVKPSRGMMSLPRPRPLSVMFGEEGNVSPKGRQESIMVSDIHTAFALGLAAAEHVHGVTRKRNQALTDAIFRILEQVARGELTLIDTPGETLASLPAPPPGLMAKAPETLKEMQKRLAAEMPGLIRQAMRDHQRVAVELLKELK